MSIPLIAPPTPAELDEVEFVSVEEPLGAPEATRQVPYTAFMLIGLVLLLPFRIWRASLEGSFWKDEFFSLMLANHEWHRFLELNGAIGAHPPTYYILLKGWMALPSFFGFDVSLLYVRMSSVVSWVLMPAGAYFIGRRIIGTPAAFLFAALLAVHPLIGIYQNFVRNYSLLYVAALAGILAFLEALRRHRAGESPAVAWICYAAAGVFGLYMNLLAGLMLFLLGIAYLFFSVTQGIRSRFAIQGAAANVAVLVLFLPYVLQRVSSNIARIKDVNFYMMEPTFANLFDLLAIREVWGRLDSMRFPVLATLVAVGIVAKLLPFVAAWWTRRGEQVRSSSPLSLSVSLGLALFLGLGYPVLLWIISRTGLMSMMHPRYASPAGVAMCLAAASAAVAAAERTSRPTLVGLLLILPVAAIALAGTARIVLREERNGGSLRYISAFSPLLPEPGGELYVMPGEMIPYYRKTLAAYTIRPIEDFLALGVSGTPPATAVVLDVSRFHIMDSPRNVAVREALLAGTLSASSETLVSQEGTPTYTGNDYFNQIWRIKGLSPDAIAKLGTQP